jgi:hypothetical protein
MAHPAFANQYKENPPVFVDVTGKPRLVDG